MRRNPWLLAAVLAASAAAVFLASSVANAAPATTQIKHPKPSTTLKSSVLAGTWSGTYSGVVSGTFTLHGTLVGSKLTGSISLSSPSGKYGPNGKYGIGGSVHGNAISFGAVGVGATYTGSVSGTSMSGTWESPQGGGSWSADKAT